MPHSNIRPTLLCIITLRTSDFLKLRFWSRFSHCASEHINRTMTAMMPHIVHRLPATSTVFFCSFDSRINLRSCYSLLRVQLRRVTLTNRGNTLRWMDNRPAMSPHGWLMLFLHGWWAHCMELDMFFFRFQQWRMFGHPGKSWTICFLQRG